MGTHIHSACPAVVGRIEKASAVENMEAMLPVIGVDRVQFRPADYSTSVERAGQSRHPRVVGAERHVIRTFLRIGGP